MCIVCDMKKAGASDEVLKLATKLANGLDEALRVATEVHMSHPDSFSKRQCDRMQKVADLINAPERSLEEVVNGVKVHFVYAEPGESLTDAIARGMAEVNPELDGASNTKH